MVPPVLHERPGDLQRAVRVRPGGPEDPEQLAVVARAQDQPGGVQRPAEGGDPGAATNLEIFADSKGDKHRQCCHFGRLFGQIFF